MEFERYEDVIDAYERDNMGYATLTDYIKGENIKIKEIEMSPLEDLKQSLKKGGPVGIEVLIMEEMKDGGRVPFRFGGRGYQGGANTGVSRGGGRSAAMGMGGKQRGGTFSAPTPTGGGGGGGPKITTTLPGTTGGRTQKTTPTAKREFGILEFAKKYNPFNLIFGTPVEAEEFKLEDLKNLGAVEKGFFGGNKLSDKGEALEKFRETATNFKFSENNPAKTPQAALDLITSDRFRGTYGKTDMVKEKDFIQTAIDKGFLGKEEDYGLQKPLDKYLADGGRVGFNVGGITDPQALAIYNSMSTYGFSDQEIADAITAQGYDAGTLGQTTTPDTPTTPTPSEGIIGIDLQQRDTGGGFNPFGPLDETFTREAGSKPSLSKDALFGLGRFFQGKERGTLGNRLQKQFQTGQKLPSLLAQIAGTRSPFNIDSKNYNPDFADQLNYLELGDDLIGMSNVGLKYGKGSVLFGKNVISGFGSNNYLTALNKFIRNTKNEERRKQGERERDAFLASEKARKEKELEAQRAATREADRAAGAFSNVVQLDPGGGGTFKQQTAAKERQGQQVAGPGFGKGAYFARGGLATMFKEKR